MTFDPTPPVFRDPDRLRAPLERPVLAIGNFDGVHRGHRSSWGSPARWLEGWRSHGKVLTFEPHSRAYIRADEQLFPLCSLADKLKLLAREELDGVVILGFNAALAGLSAAAFVESPRRPSRRVGRRRRGGLPFRPGPGRQRRISGPQRRGIGLRNRRVAVARGRRDANVLLRHQVRHHGRSGREGGGHARALLVRRRPCRVRPGRAAADCDQSRMHDRYGLYAVRVAAQGQVRDAVATRSPASRTGRAVLSLTLLDGAEDLGNGTVTVEFVAWIRGCALPLGGSLRRAPFTRPYGSDTGVIGRPVRRDHRIRVAVVAAAMIP